MKKIISILSVLIIMMLSLTGCGNETNKKSETSKVSEEDLMKNVKTEYVGITEHNEFVFKIKNNNNKDVYIDNAKVYFNDADGNFATDERAHFDYFYVPANSEVYNYVWGMSDDYSKYPTHQIKLSTGREMYKYSNRVSVAFKDNDKKLAVKITNNDDFDVNTIQILAVYLKENKIVGVEEGLIFEEKIEANGGVGQVSIDHPYSSNYDDVKYDDVQVFVISAHN